MHTYQQSTGLWLLPNGAHLHGYSGHGEGRNAPACEAEPDIGPCPRGLYNIGPAHSSSECGPLTMNLDPIDHDACGRTLLRVHGDNAQHDASHGCIIIPGAINRARINWFSDRILKVIE